MNSNRWWEFYFVRYAMGTLVGAAVAYFLARELQLFGVDQNEMSFYEAAALLSAGLTFCYLSSGPILVFHAGRFLWRSITWITIIVMLVALVVGAVLMYCGCTYSWFVSACIIFIAQACIGFCCLCNVRLITCRYRRLARYRAESSSAEGKERKEGEEFIESYRHLGEHGNSFFILFLEIIVALAIIDILHAGTFATDAFKVDAKQLSDNLLFLLTCLAFWTLPPIAVWGLAKQMEYTLAE